MVLPPSVYEKPDTNVLSRLAEVKRAPCCTPAASARASSSRLASGVDGVVLHANSHIEDDIVAPCAAMGRGWRRLPVGNPSMGVVVASHR